MPKDPYRISFLVPVYNEGENIRELYKRIKAIPGDRLSSEIVFVNDGSSDRSLDIMKELARGDKSVKIVSLSRNFGHQIAIKAGLGFVKADATVVMDADLQDPPDIIGEMIKKWQDGYQVVYAVRKTRKEPLLLRFLYAAFYRLLQRMSKIRIPLDAGDFCLLDKEVVSILAAMPEKNPFIRGLRCWIGYDQTGVSYDRQKRFAGKSKYGFLKLVKLALDGMLSFSNIPLRISTTTGFLISGAAVILIISLLINRLPMPGTTLIAILVLFMGGVQLISIGILGEYIGRIYEESKNRPPFIIRETVNLDNFKK